MPTQTRVVRLLQNTLYPTYQLHATMSSKQTAPCGRSAVCRPHGDGMAAAADGRGRAGRTHPARAQPIQGGGRRLSAIAAYSSRLRHRHRLATKAGRVELANHRAGPWVRAG